MRSELIKSVAVSEIREKEVILAVVFDKEKLLKEAREEFEFVIIAENKSRTKKRGKIN